MVEDSSTSCSVSRMHAVLEHTVTKDTTYKFVSHGCVDAEIRHETVGMHFRKSWCPLLVQACRLGVSSSSPTDFSSHVLLGL